MVIVKLLELLVIVVVAYAVAGVIDGHLTGLKLTGWRFWVCYLPAFLAGILIGRLAISPHYTVFAFLGIVVMWVISEMIIKSITGVKLTVWRSWVHGAPVYLVGVLVALVRYILFPLNL